MFNSVYSVCDTKLIFALVIPFFSFMGLVQLPYKLVVMYLRFSTQAKVYELQVVVFINQQVFLKLRHRHFCRRETSIKPQINTIC